jgi:hypothetical protein
MKKKDSKVSVNSDVNKEREVVLDYLKWIEFFRFGGQGMILVGSFFICATIFLCFFQKMHIGIPLNGWFLAQNGIHLLINAFLFYWMNSVKMLSLNIYYILSVVGSLSAVLQIAMGWEIGLFKSCEKIPQCVMDPTFFDLFLVMMILVFVCICSICVPLFLITHYLRILEKKIK